MLTLASWQVPQIPPDLAQGCAHRWLSRDRHRHHGHDWKQSQNLVRRFPWLPCLTPDLPSLSEPARSTRLILEVMYFSFDKVREWAYKNNQSGSLTIMVSRPHGSWSTASSRLTRELTRTST